MPVAREIFLKIHEVQRLQKALQGTNYIIVGGAVRDIVRYIFSGLADQDILRFLKDIDCQVDLPNKEDLTNLMKKHYREHEMKVQQLAVTVGSPTDLIEAIDVVLFQRDFDPKASENDVNSLIFILETGMLVDPFGTGLENLRKLQFRIVEPDIETWYTCPYQGRANNGKAPRLLKMLNMGFSFEDAAQQAQFIACVKRHFPQDLTDKVIQEKFSVWAMVLGMTIRGDIFNRNTGEITVGTCPIKRSKYEGCLAALCKLDAVLGEQVRVYMNEVTKRHMCPDRH